MATTVTSLERLFSSGQFRECAEQGRSLQSTIANHPTVRTMVEQCQRQDQEIQADKYLAEAQQLAKRNKYREAIAVLSKVDAHTPAYRQAQQLGEDWSSRLLKIATDQYQREGKYNQAIALLKEIPKDTDSGKKAQTMIANWEKEWRRNQDYKKQAEAALKAQDWSKVLEMERKVTTPYWKKALKPMLDEANTALARAYIPPVPSDGWGTSSQTSGSSYVPAPVPADVPSVPQQPSYTPPPPDDNVNYDALYRSRCFSPDCLAID